MPAAAAAPVVHMGSRSRSRSNSDSSSLATVKRSTSLTSRSNPRTALLLPRGTSPQAVYNDRTSSRRRGSSSEDAGGALYTRNVNRWSHSTSSSVSAIDVERVRRGQQQQQQQQHQQNHHQQPHHHHHHHHHRYNDHQSQLPVRTNSSLHPPPLTQNYSQPTSKVGRGSFHQQYSRGANESSVTIAPTSVYNTNASNTNISTVTSPAATTTTTTATDYFGEPWEARTKQNTKLGEPIAAMSIQYTDPKARNIAPDRSPSPPPPPPSNNQTPHRNRGHRSPTQKSMLSKALSVANDAVRLDNCQNIDGAIASYAEACDLLQQVMLRSSDADDRRKLSLIWSTYSNRIAQLHDLDDSFANLINKDLPEDPPVDDDYNGTFFASLSEPTAADVLEKVQIPPRHQSLAPGSPGPSPADTIRADMGTTGGRSSAARDHMRGESSSESTSWLDNIDEGESSSQPSSKFSSISVGHNHAITTTTTTQKAYDMMDEIEADFDAAVNAAVSAAYESDREREERPQPGLTSSHDNGIRDYLDDDTTEEEERLLHEISHDFAFDDFHFGPIDSTTTTSSHGNNAAYHSTSASTSISALPRQSDSSTFSGKTFSSSIPSVPSTTLTTSTSLGMLAGSLEPPKPPPTKAVPPTPADQHQQYAHHSKQASGGNLRERRLSNQTPAAQLKIETYAPVRGTMQPPSKKPPPPPPLQQTQHQQPPQLQPAFMSASSESLATPMLGRFESFEEAPLSPSRATTKMLPPSGPIRKTLSSSSLRIRTTSINEEAPPTPGSGQFPADVKKGVPPMPTSRPAAPTSVPSHHSIQSGGMYLFDDRIGAGAGAGTASTSKGPLPLEPCPESFLLRPWWLMRCLHTAISQPGGGYMSNKLFLPQDIWRVRNVKLKMVDDKVAQCDLLTAALLKLSKVNEFDADAVLDELQSFENVVDQVRVVLQKKLGSDVGLSGSTSAFRSPSEEVDAKSGTGSKNAFTSSWRKLRSKSSNAVGASSQYNLFQGKNESPTTTGSNGGAGISPSTNGAVFTMPSLPMTANAAVPTSRSYTRRHNSSNSSGKTHNSHNNINISNNNNSNNNAATPSTPNSFLGSPHATYMASLARLFDAVHVLDAIARQVEDPGLKCSSQTQVGLELGVRGAAEFFAFYILRFVMTDIGILLDKFLKRGTEWVLA